MLNELKHRSKRVELFNRELTLEDENNIINMYNEGESINDISLRMSLTKNIVTLFLKDYNKSEDNGYYNRFKRVVYRPNIGKVIDPKTGKEYYDVTELFLDFPKSYQYEILNTPG